jgi:hypothetical protein
VAKHYGGIYDGNKERSVNKLNTNIKNDSEILMSKAKGFKFFNLVDERFISAKLNSEIRSSYPHTEKRNPFESSMYRQTYYESVDEGVKEIPTVKMMNLLAMKYPKRLHKLADNSEQAEKDLNSILIRNIDKTIETFKNNFYTQSTNNLLDEHTTNIDSLNKLLIGPFSILVATDMVESNQEVLIHFSEGIKSNTINFNKAIGLNLFDSAKYKLFFGDDASIIILIKLIEEKLKDIKVFSKKISETKGSVLSSDRIGVSVNPFLSKEKKFNIMSYYNESMNKHAKDQLEHLDSLLELLKSRLRLNNILLPNFIKYISQQHKQIAL